MGILPKEKEKGKAKQNLETREAVTIHVGIRGEIQKKKKSKDIAKGLNIRRDSTKDRKAKITRKTYLKEKEGKRARRLLEVNRLRRRKREELIGRWQEWKSTNLLFWKNRDGTKDRQKKKKRGEDSK